MSTVIKIENLSKKYVIGHQRQERYTALRDVVMHKLRGVGEKLRHPLLSTDKKETDHEEFWALKDINMEIKQGDRVGIIGRNGAGKSTLLKVLSRITEPTSGRITIRGRVASLLEVGTGFHPELTGRENIFLNGAILGMSRLDIKKNFDEIVAFAEVEKFLDTPVKRYSSGMYVRLAFAVAAHLEPEILIVDEVLAVGDFQFQKKCLGKMEKVGKEGRTILFVSHQMGAIAQLCDNAVLLQNGCLLESGAVSDVVTSYMQSLASGASGYEAGNISCSKDIAIVSGKTFDSAGNPSSNFTHNQEITVTIRCKVNRWTKGSEVRLSVRDAKRNVFTTDTELLFHGDQPSDVLCAQVVIPANVLRPETYFFTLATYLPNQVIFDLVNDALSITVIDGGSKYAASEGLDYGCVFVDCKWSIKDISSSTGT